MRRFIALLIGIMILGGCTAMGEGDYTAEAWYPEALRESQMSLGNNLRLKNVIERAKNGEFITIATVGGSITEGAAASSYEECWASRFTQLFGETFCAEGRAALVNCGVGGTPSPFGWMRYGRDILERVPEEDPDGYPDIVVIEYAVNDWNEPTGGRAYESMVKGILQQPNAPAVILLFSARSDGWNLQDIQKAIGNRYDLMMVSISKGIWKHLGKDFPSKSWYSDEYHPRSAGHAMMADALLQAVKDAAEAESSPADIDLDVKPVYGTDFMGLTTLYGDRKAEGFTVTRGGFDKTDKTAYSNRPVGLVCGKNFCRGISSGDEPLTITGTFSKCLISWKASNDPVYGTAEVLVDGKVKATLKGNAGSWGQSEVVLVLDDAEATEHTVEIRVKEEGKRFTVTAVSLR